MKMKSIKHITQTNTTIKETHIFQKDVEGIVLSLKVECINETVDRAYLDYNSKCLDCINSLLDLSWQELKDVWVKFFREIKLDTAVLNYEGEALKITKLENDYYGFKMTDQWEYEKEDEFDMPPLQITEDIDWELVNEADCELNNLLDIYRLNRGVKFSEIAIENKGE